MSGSRSRRACVAVVASALLVGLASGGGHLERVALAEEPPPAQPRRVVEVLIAAGDEGASDLDDTVRELLARLTLVMDSKVVPRLDPDDPTFRSFSRPSLLARVGIDLRARDVASVIIADARTGEITARRSVRRDRPPAVVREEIAHVVQAAVDPILLAERDRAASALAVSAAPPPIPPPPAAAPAPPAVVSPGVLETPGADVAPAGDAAAARPTARTRSPLALDVTLMAGAGTFGAGAGVVGRAGFGAALVWRRGLRPSIGIGGHYMLPFEAGDRIAVAQVTAGALRAETAIEAYRGGSFAVDVGAGGGVDVLGVEARSDVLPADRLGRPSTRVDPVLTGTVKGHLAVGAGLTLALALALDVDLASPRWVTEREGTRADVFAPSRLRPLALLGFSFTGAGEPRFGAR